MNHAADWENTREVDAIVPSDVLIRMLDPNTKRQIGPLNLRLSYQRDGGKFFGRMESLASPRAP